MPERPEKLRIVITELEPRSPRREQELARLLRRTGSPEGQPCEADCDCQVGLRCLDGLCVEA